MAQAQVMTHPNVEMLSRLDEAMLAQDFATFFAQYADDVVVHMGGDNQLTGDYRGVDQLQAVFGRYMQAAGEVSFQNYAYLANDDRGVVLQRLTLQRDGRTFATDEVFVYRFRDGKIAEFWYQPWDQAGIDLWLGK